MLPKRPSEGSALNKRPSKSKTRSEQANGNSPRSEPSLRCSASGAFRSDRRSRSGLHDATQHQANADQRCGELEESLQRAKRALAQAQKTIALSENEVHEIGLAAAAAAKDEIAVAHEEEMLATREACGTDLRAMEATCEERLQGMSASYQDTLGALRRAYEARLNRHAASVRS